MVWGESQRTFQLHTFLVRWLRVMPLWVHSPSLTTCMTVGTLSNLPVPQFLLCKMGIPLGCCEDSVR